jgi:superoxide dismutase, Fe-Mn family
MRTRQTGGCGAGTDPFPNQEDTMAFTLPPLPYPNDALEPSIDKMTMEIHHDRHHKAYVDNANKALEGNPELQSKTVEQLLREISKVPEKIRQPLINNAGGHANHSMFWEIMGKGAGGKPTGPLGDDINKAFGDFAAFQTALKTAGVGRFGSGWSWLVFTDGKLQVISSANQDSPYMNGQAPVMGLDVWEHAYYLKYQNKRADYVDAWWNVVNWTAVAQRYSNAKAGK